MLVEMLLASILPGASAYLTCAGVTTVRSIGPPEFTFFVTLRSTERIARPRNQRLLLWCG
jgi:hypothetical protein